MSEEARAAALLDAMRRLERCRPLIASALRRYRGPTPERYKAAYVARANRVRELAA